MEYKRLQQMKAKKSRRKVLLTLALLLSCGMASAQVTIKGNVYGGGKLGDVSQNTSVTINNDTVKGSVYGGGQGIDTLETMGLVKGNTLVTMKGGQVQRSIYGGGELGSVGTFTSFDTVTYTAGTYAGKKVPVPNECQQGTGITKVLIHGGLVGVRNPKMPSGEDDDDYGYIFAAGRGEADSIHHYRAIAMAVSDSSYLEIKDKNADVRTVVSASVYGGSENGLVLRNTHVKLLGGQIGIGYYKDNENIEHWDDPYTDEQWTQVITAIKNATFANNTSLHNIFHECDAFPFGDGHGNFYIYDCFADSTGYNSNGGSTHGSNGHSFFGNVFGGGSGFYPFWDEENRKAVWRRTAGRVNGNTLVELVGGHVLTSLYGGNEYTDVVCKSTVKMTAGTLGVPRDSIHTVRHPVTCYLFGAGMGDRRVWANTWNNVGSAEVSVTGGAIFGSIFGGGEEGHVLGDVKVTVDGANTLVGTLGYSYVDGNVFGGGRGFSGEALTAGAVGGNITVNIKDGLILGSIYGGGRMASVGTHFTDPNSSDYGQMQEGNIHGKVTIDISGGTIGNDHESKYHHWGHTYGGNVFGGSMGRIEKLDGNTNPLWPYMAKVKDTDVTIREANGKKPIIKGNVYGGGEFGVVTANTNVKIQGGTVWSDVYGGGEGSEDIIQKAAFPKYNSTTDSVQIMPLQRAGLVEGNTNVSISGGWVKKSVYGGGLLASVGTIVNDTTSDQYRHELDSVTFALSWPYEFIYKENTGTATLNITGGRVGLTGKDYLGPWNESGVPYNPTTNSILTSDEIKAAREDDGDLYGGSKGKAGDRYLMAHHANVNNTVVNITYPNNDATPENYKPEDWVSGYYPTYQNWTTYGTLGCLPGAVYGGGENGHVINNTNVTLNKGLVGHNIYGGGKGTDTYTVTLWHYNAQLQPTTSYEAEVPSITAGKVYNNTNVTVNGGYVVRNIFGGGNRASVGKGNYAGGPGDYQEAGYGERWTTENDPLRTILANSGHTYIKVNGGQIGTVDGEKDDLPTGNVFGGCRGEAAPNAPQTLSPRILYYPQFFLGYVNHTHVTIGETPKATPDANSPRLFGSVYGGGQDGHVRWGTQVVVNDAEIGNAYVNPVAAKELVDTANLEHFQWVGRGNVYGSGSGTGTYKDENNEDRLSYSSGSVTGFTDVTINGGKIHRNVYGGGSLAIVGPPRIRLKYDANRKQTLSKVTINSYIGDTLDVIGGTYTVMEGEGEQAHEVTKSYTYGGQVFGGSRGELANNEETFSTTIYTEVNLGEGAIVPGNVYGGGEYGQVKQCTDVKMAGGTVGVIDYVRKHNTATTRPLDSIAHLCGGSVFGGGKGDKDFRAEALVKDSTNVTISGGHVLLNVYGGGEMASVGLRDTIFTDNTHSVVKDFRPKADIHGNDSTGVATVTILRGQVGPAPMLLRKQGSTATEYDSINIPIGLNGTDGYVFGGGKGIGNDPNKLYKEIADANSTFVTVNMPMPTADDSITNRLWGSMFGGAEDGHVLGDAHVKYMSGLVGTNGTTSYDGNIFGGGRNYSGKNFAAGRVRGNNNIEMTGGHLLGSIFGGGRLAQTGVDINGRIIADADGRRYGNDTVRVKGGKVGNPRLIENFTEFSMGDVFGGGKGSMKGLDDHDRTSALLVCITKNTYVEIDEANANDPTVIYGTVYGGGEVANVGSCTWKATEQGNIYDVMPIPGTGNTTVKVKGGRIGIDHMRMRYDLVDGDGKYDFKYNNNLGHVFGGGQGVISDPNAADDDPDNPLVNGGQNHLADIMAITFNSNVIIEGGWVKGSVYGGGENGHVWWDTDVKIKGGQIGAGYYPETTGTPSKDSLYYGTNQFFNPLDYFDPRQYENYIAPFDVAQADTLAECYSWPLVKTGDNANRPFDPVLVKQGKYPTDGKTWFGNVFGGGSGYLPFVKYNETTHKYEAHWNPQAGKVLGNTHVEITGGHILTSVYGGCEITDVVGNATVVMRGGTLGVPRSLPQIDRHPVTCYLYGGGKGDPRTYFNTKTNVAKANVEVTGGIIYGSVFGGGEDGHVLDSAIVNIGGDAIIGTTGRSYVDGNVFGGGRGYSGFALTAGVVGGNVKVDISGGTMLGSIYGGGRLASVGTYLVDTTDTHYGEMQPDNSNGTHGHITINISGGEIGNDYESRYHTNFEQHLVGGNVFAGAMGRIKKIDGVTVDPLWTRQAKVRKTELVVSDSAVIKGNVYGGGEFGTVAGDADINIEGGEIWRDVYGGGYGSSDDSFSTALNPSEPDAKNSPMQLAGRVYGNSNVTVSGGWIKKSVYGGGELASVGTIKNDSVMHTTANQFALSWPFEFNYENNTGKASIEMTGGRVGVTGKDILGPYDYKEKEGEYVLVPVNKPINEGGHELVEGTQEYKDARVDNGDLYGGGKGLAGKAYKMAHLANVSETDVYIHYNDSCNATPKTYKKNLLKGCITGAVYGGGENGHVNADTRIRLSNGLVGHAVYGGGKGKDMYTNASGDKVYSLTAGKVYGNTTIDISGGYVVRSVFGGGNTASVGKGNYVNYPPGATDFDETGTSVGGLCTINITGGTLGMLKASDPADVFKDNIPYGSVFGGCRGLVEESSDNLSSNVAHLSFVNNTKVTISGDAMMHGSVYGGGQDGHVRYNTEVTVNGGEIGVPFLDSLNAMKTVGSLNLDTLFWAYRGNVFGGGSGIGMYETYRLNDQNENDTIYHFSRHAGSVMGKADVKIQGGRIHRNVYGGGNLGLVGDGDLATTDDIPTVTISGTAKVGLAADVDGVYYMGSGEERDTVYYSYGGSVFGAGRGFPTDTLNTYCNVDQTSVKVIGGHVYGDVYGGGEDGHVLGNTDVKIQGGTIGTHGVTNYDGNVFGGGKGSSYCVITGTGVNADTTYHLYKTSGRVGGNTNITMTAGSTKASIFGGGRLALSGVNANGEFPAPGGREGDSWGPDDHGKATVNIEGGTVGTSATDSLLICDNSVGDVFGSGKGDFDNYQMVEAGRVTNTIINIKGNSTVIHGNVVGGGEMASIGWWGSDAKYYDGTGKAIVTIGGDTPTNSTNPYIGSRNELLYNPQGSSSNPNPGQWTMYEDGQLIHTCTGNVFGGGQGDVDTTCAAWVSMARVRETMVTINGGSIMACVYGGGEQGAVTGDTKVTVNGGTVGSFVSTSTNSFYFGGVIGAGYGSDDPKEDNSTWPNDSTNARQAYGSTPAIMAGRVYGDSRVDILGGTILGNVYGGGERAYLGYEASNTKGNAIVNIGGKNRAGYVGNATFGTNSSVFGANKFAGTPWGDTQVHIYQTAHTPQNTCPEEPEGGWTDELMDANADTMQYAIKAVYGGGDRSNYIPHQDKYALTHVWSCLNTIEELYGGGNAADIGSNNNDYNTNDTLIVDGGRLHRVFGGGNGSVVPANIYGAANTYINGGAIDQVFGGSNNHGTILTVYLNVEGTNSCSKFIHELFGGSSAAPDYGDHTVEIVCGESETTGVSTIYGGADHAQLIGNLTVNVRGGDAQYVFAGSKGTEESPGNILKYPTIAEIDAHPENYPDGLKAYLLDHLDLVGTGGNLTLNIYGGTIRKAAFGGNDFSGRIEGKITINVIDTVTTCPLVLEDLYGGGRSAAYEPVDPSIASPEINIIHGTVNGTVYGGGMGASATVKANPVVNVGYNANTMTDIVAPLVADGFNLETANAIVKKNVYGGGNRAGVEGNPIVNIMRSSTTIGTLYADGTLQQGTGNVFGGGQGVNTSTSYAQVQGNNTVKIKSGKVYGNVFGGGEIASVTGNTRVELTGGEIGVMTPDGHDDELDLDKFKLVGGRVFGGGQGDDQGTDMDLNKNLGRVFGNTYVSVSDTVKIHNCVYGGGMLGSVGNGNLNDKNSGVATVIISGGEIGPLDGSGKNAYVYGGGRGKDNDPDPNNLYKDFANVDSTSVIVSDSARIYGSIFGGGSDGHVLGSARVEVKKGENTKNKIPVIGTKGTTSWDGNIFGGGRNYLASNTAAGRVGGNITVKMSDGMLYGSVFGGGRLGGTGVGIDGVNDDIVNVNDRGFITVDISGGQIGRNETGHEYNYNATSGHVFGGGKGIVDNDKPKWPDMGLAIGTKVIIRGDNTRIFGSVYGGGENASVMQNDSVFIQGGEIGKQYGTPGNSNYAQKGSVFGGGRGTESDSKVNIYHIPAYNMAGRCLGNTYVKIENGTIHNNVYGGGELASVGDTTNTNYTNTSHKGLAHVVVSGGHIGTESVTQTADNEGNVYGGGLGMAGRDEQHFSNVDRTLVEFKPGAYVTSSVFGGSQNGHVLGDANVVVSGGIVGRRLTADERYVDDKNAHVAVYTGNVYGGGRGATPVNNAGTEYSAKAGRVYGNTNVTVSGGNVRHNVYGGGSLASVGTFTTNAAGVITDCQDGTGVAAVRISGDALIGPMLNDLIKDADGNACSQQVIDTAFKYLGGNEGCVYGSSRGLKESIYDNLAFTDSTSVIVEGNANVVSGVFGGGENGHVHHCASVVINGGIIGAVPLHGDTISVEPYYTQYHIEEGPYAGVDVRLKSKDAELYEDQYGSGRRVFRGSVFGGGRGSDAIIDLTTTPPTVSFNPKAGRVYGNTNVEITGGKIYSHVYGGGTLASVGDYNYDSTVTDSIVSTKSGGTAVVMVSGGQIGTDGNNNGSVYGGGLGVSAKPKDKLTYLAYVDSTNVTICGNAKVRNSVYGGSSSGHVLGNTKVTVKGDAKIGYAYLPEGAPEGSTDSLVHGKWHSNVYGGGGGVDGYISNPTTGAKHLSISSGRVFGDTEVNIEGGTVYHNVYGGGSIASVGNYILNGHGTPYAGYETGHGKAVINITGGTIGYNGDNNGMVFGSARGEADAPGAFMDSLSYVAYSEVNIGTLGTDGPIVKGSVYGSGENGHVHKKAVVNVLSGIIGCSATEYASMSEEDKLKKFPNRGNVYGAGCGTDMYDSNNDHILDAYNAGGGIVQDSTVVNIRGGYISRNVYGGGALASVGTFTTELRHKTTDASKGDTLSWPVKLNYANATTGRAEVNIYGGHIGTMAAPPATTGNVFGSSRGKAGDRYEWAPFANVRNAYVKVDFTPNDDNRIVGSVFGSGESGHVYDNTYVTVDKGLVMGSVFGAGDGTETYETVLLHDKDGNDGHGNTWQANDSYTTEVRSITAGKVYGNTNVTINGGTIQHNVYGGGNFASVGKGNYKGYGEGGTISEGVTTVTVNGGTIGTNGYKVEGEQGALNGFVFGSSRGITYPTISARPRYNYTRDFFLGYVNNSNVIIGSSTTSPVVKGSVFGGGDNGHVRENTDVTVNSGEIGATYAPGTGETITDAKWKYRGNVYGAGRGVDFIPDTEEYCSSAGSVTINTTVTVNGGTIHRDVYGGGSLATVGPPPTYAGESLSTVNIIGGTIGDATGVASEYGGNVYGSGRGEIAAQGNILDTLASVKETVVNIGKKTVDGETVTLSGSGLVNGSVYGSGENGHVNTNATVNIYSGRVGDTDNTNAQANVYCGNVYGAGSGTDTYKVGGVDRYNPVAGIVKGNTTINIEGGWVMRSVYGGGEMASVGTVIDSIQHIAEATIDEHHKQSPFYLSWPYEFTYANNTGKATIKVTGGRVGITGKDSNKDNGDVYGGGKGMTGDDYNVYKMAHFANVKETDITIDIPNSSNDPVTPDNYKELGRECITGAVYGGSENGHVYEDTHIQLDNGLIGHAVYGGGKGKGKYTISGSTEQVYSITAGKVFGNTNININGGNVVRSVFGGGNLASVGKGNYIGLVGGENATAADDIAFAKECGHTNVFINGGTLGMLNPDDPTKAFKDNIPYGSVFGGSRGEVMAPVANEEDLFGYVNYTFVEIGVPEEVGPRLYGSVYGGAQDGHVRWDTKVTVNSGKIGVIYGEDNVSNIDSIANNPNSVHWIARGNVLGGGSGLGTYEVTQTNPETNQNETVQHHNPTAGIVNCNAQVIVEGGEICRDIYGGGNKSSVGRATPITDEEDEGYTRVFVNDGTVRGSVFGGGNQSIVYKERVVTIQGDAIVKGDVYAGSDDPAEGVSTFTSLKTVNVRGGQIEGSVFGGSHNANEGVSPMAWTGFVNISGGTIGTNGNGNGNVFAAGNGGTVNGSLCVNIGKQAILQAPTYATFNNPQSGAANRFYNVKEDGTVYTAEALPTDELVIHGDVYGGSHHFGNNLDAHWNDYDVAGFSMMFVDGEGYDTEHDQEHANDADKPYMNLLGSVYGSGMHCESGRIGRGIVLRHYGHRTDDTDHRNELVQATRSLATIQHGGIVVLDSTNVNLTGASPISMPEDETKYGVIKADLGLYLLNASGIVLGAADHPAYMDSIKVLKSMYLPKGEVTYHNILGESAQTNWELVGIKDMAEAAKLYRLRRNADNSITPVELSKAEENVIIFNDESKLWVRYHGKQSGDNQVKQYYGELEGFFRMRGDSYDPHGTESFAFARPKIIDASSLEEGNLADGGFVSYADTCNYFKDNTTYYNGTNQYPYINVMYDRGDRTEYRMWVGPERSVEHWYVDGREGGWGRDDVSKKNDAGLYPDKPKKTLFGTTGYKGIVSEVFEEGTQDAEDFNYSYEKDQIYVVGALSEFDEAVLQNSTYFDPSQSPALPLRIYRYPGGHAMSNGVVDNGGGSAPANLTAWHAGAIGNKGPGANYGAILEVNANDSIVMQGVVIDGLYGFTEDDVALHQIPSTFDPTRVNEPLVVTNTGSRLSICDSTVLMRGYNNLDAAAWYTDADYKSYVSTGAIHNGGAMFVDSTAKVYVKDTVTIMGNKQRLQGDAATAKFIESNVYLPTFDAHLYMYGALNDSTKIGVTSPRRNRAASYLDNTFSPVAEATVSSNWALDAWNHCNFRDDQNWFFVNNHTADSPRTTYYYQNSNKSGMDDGKTVFFGWTWANAVRKQPVNFDYDNIDSPEDLAWLISQSAGMNGQDATDFKDVSIEQTRDIDLNQYVWVPIGDSIVGSTDHKPFVGSYDGKGHLISNMNINYIGRGDRRYERKHYGLFGYVKKGSVDRTFVVSGRVSPVATITLSDDDFLNVGGLVGCLEDATISNSEAALKIIAPSVDNENIVTGGLVGTMVSGEIHSSMVMPYITTSNVVEGYVGGLVGRAETGTIYNSFVNGAFSIGSKSKAGGLLGFNEGATMKNCYVNWENGTPGNTVFNGIVYGALSDSKIDYCYDKKEATIAAGSVSKHCKEFTPASISSDVLGYMYKDNVVGADSTLFQQLNRWVDSTNKANGNHTYARWARPGLAEINGDLPVLLLNEYDVLSGGVPISHQGSFRSVGTYAGTSEVTHALQYGGTVRDGNEIDGALSRALLKNNEGHDIPECLFVYGDVNNVGNNVSISQSKVSIHEDAAISNPAALTSFENTYVGVTFDNSHINGEATSTPGMNIYIMGAGDFLLPRDWHMFSSPLGNAPLGFNYRGHNVDNLNYSNNPWLNMDEEFNWITTGPGSDECYNGEGADYHYWRYWMNDFDPEVQTTDGYFPTRRGGLFGNQTTDIDKLFLVGSDECPSSGHNRYPYGMDLYTWTEPDYHWINFKRNGPNHWHSDMRGGQHEHINYEPIADAPNVNESELIVGRGYMGAIATETFMQSHGMLNSGDQTIELTNTSTSRLNGWNLVGNPYHGYLDFNRVGAGVNNNVLSHYINGNNVDEGAFYVIYDADQYKGHDASTAFRYYPVSGSPEGDYASRFLHPHQGFYVRTEQPGGGTLTFTESMLVNRKDIELEHDTCTFRSTNLSYPLVNMYLNSDKGCADVTVIEFNRPEWGGARKLKELRVGDGLFYAHHDDAYYAALFAKEGVDRVPLWFEAKEDDIFTMKWNLANADFHSMYLIDNIAGVEYDMLKNDTYMFEGHTDDYPSRFLIVFDLTKIDEQMDDNSQNFAFFAGSEWVVTGDGDLQFIDALGQVLAEQHVSGQTRVFLPQVADGPYLFRLINGKETKIQKVIITK